MAGRPSPLIPPDLRSDLPVYPPTQQLLRVTATTIGGPAGVAQVAGSSVLAPPLHVAFTQQLMTGSLIPRDREPCLAAAMRGYELTPGFHLGRLAGSWTGLPVYEVVEIGLIGSAGLMGPIGSQGPAGAIGSTGNPGTQGTPGATGSTGNPGTQGSPGAPGSSGVVGQPGAQGQAGPTGSTGNPGTQGTQGPPGSTGDQGIPGLSGATGSTGNPGTQGLPGIQGPSGATGSTGDPGTQGSQGNQGVQGPIGPVGSTGNPGTPGTPGGPPGPQGSIGPPGPAGSTGNPGTQGSPGPVGSTGNPGTQGQQGPAGNSTGILLGSGYKATGEATTSTTFTDLGTIDEILNGITLTETITTLVIKYQAVVLMPSGIFPESAHNVLVIDGSQVSASEVNFTSGSTSITNLATICVYKDTYGAGNHTFKVQHKTSNGSSVTWKTRLLEVYSSP